MNVSRDFRAVLTGCIAFAPRFLRTYVAQSLSFRRLTRPSPPPGRGGGAGTATPTRPAAGPAGAKRLHAQIQQSTGGSTTVAQRTARFSTRRPRREEVWRPPSRLRLGAAIGASIFRIVRWLKSRLSVSLASHHPRRVQHNNPLIALASQLQVA